MSEQREKALLVLGSPNHSALYNILAGDYKILVFEEVFGAQALQGGLPVALPSKMLTQDNIIEARYMAFTYAKQVLQGIDEGWLHLDPTDTEREMLTGKWFPMWFIPYLYDHLAQVIGMIFGLAHAVERFDIHGIITHEDVTAGGRTLVEFGKAEGIPTLHMPHANHFLKPDPTDVHCQIHSDWIGCAGSYMRDWYTECGADPDKMELLGMLNWDFYYNSERQKITKDEARRALGLEQDDLVFTFAATWPQMLTAGGQAWKTSIDILDGTCDKFLKAAKEMGAKVIVKIHPTGGKGRSDYYKGRMEALEVKGCVTRVWNRYVVPAADCVVTQTSSNFAFESMLQGVPACEIYAPGSRNVLIPGAWDHDIVDCIQNTMDNYKQDEADEILKQANYDNDGQALPRTIDWIKRKLYNDGV